MAPARGEKNAVDPFNSLRLFVALRAYLELYDEWLYSHVARTSCDHRTHSHHQRSPSFTIVNQKESSNPDINPRTKRRREYERNSNHS